MPSVNGLVVTVTETDTLESLAAKYHVTEARIIELNQLDDPTLVVGQVLILPGAKGAAIPTPKPTPKPVAKPAAKPRVTSSGHSTSGGSSGGGSAHYSGGTFRWPVVGGGNYISQYFHSGHYGVDIAADYGSRVVAAAGGKVIFAGWKSNGGGWQVWISHGSGLYTTYNHMSGAHRRQRPERRARPAGGPHRCHRQRDRSAPPLRGLARHDLERRHRGSTRCRYF